MLTCKPGDLAVVITSLAGNEGKIVRVIRFLGKVDGWIGNDRWPVDGVLKGTQNDETPTARDSQLRPLRDTDGEDEMLQIVGLPKSETV